MMIQGVTHRLMCRGPGCPQSPPRRPGSSTGPGSDTWPTWMIREMIVIMIILDHEPHSMSRIASISRTGRPVPTLHTITW